MAKFIGKVSILILLVFVVQGCAGVDSGTSRDSSRNALRVGITPDYPPLIFKTKEEVKGVEADLAFRLGKALNRQVQYVELPWDQQIPALIEGKIDIIMSGMTVTDERKARINFADPYLKSGLLTLMRAEDSPYYRSLEDIQASPLTVGVIKGTTGESFVRRNFPNAANVIALQRASDAPNLLRNNRIDLYVDDAPSVIWLASENEGTLKGFWKLLNQEYLGWGVRREDQELLTRANAILRDWKKDGTLREVLNQWLPYWEKL